MLREDDLDDFKDFSNPDFRDLEKDNLTGRNEEDSILANTPVKVLTAKSIIGDRIENPMGEKLGDIKDIMLNIQNGGVEYVVVEFGGFLGIGEKLFAIPYHELTLNPDRKVFVLNRSRAELEKAPGFDKDHWPETNSRHFDDVNYFWGYMGKRGVENSDTGFTM